MKKEYKMSFSEALNNEIETWFKNLDLPSKPEGLYAPISYTMESGGKRLRPTLLLATVKAFGGKSGAAKNACIGIEMFHNFTLLHDDVMDNSEVRRGKPTVHRRWNDNTAILSGDTMLTIATQYIARCEEKYLKRVLDTFNATAIEVYEGQQLDMDFETRDDVSIPEYLEMIKLKTSVLLGCCLKTGGIFGGADDETIERLYDYGVNLGLGFQLRDDYLDTFGDEEVFGKKIGGDIVNNKKTWLMISAVNEDRTGVLKDALQNKFPDKEKIEKVTKIYMDLKLDTRILDLIKEYSEKAAKSVENLQIDEDAKKYFIALARNLVERMN